MIKTLIPIVTSIALTACAGTPDTYGEGHTSKIKRIDGEWLLIDTECGKGHYLEGNKCVPSKLQQIKNSFNYYTN